ncbi:glutathione S-transferase family protein [Sansalvadorimonas sp. 2012CJ34-2]|uniref:glutathione transferase n=1 Tax=Parendozoicomonas callyspongiae TaxID=2942213 RepID=A0ABT0PAM0_9GAMM|nr:glutathione S-transferase family protein [Sansalvadorimonas sp. 2012CJ34-2]MCL6268410.1 glutathione S-transferase family protein [Sansalvadorimonas sp. 2012CJ34-2]
MSQNIELISFKLCPFVQRSVITLLEKKVPFDITYIDLSNKPDWFLELSPTGKVPVLKTQGEVVFESAVINEYLDEITPPSLHPKDPLIKAKHRAWIEFSSSLLMGQYKVAFAQDRNAAEEEQKALTKQLAHLEKSVSDGPLFAGQDFCLVDAAVAPFFMRVDLHNRHFGVDILDGFSRLKTWQSALLDRDSVRYSVVDNFEALTMERLEAGNSWMVQESK